MAAAKAPEVLIRSRLAASHTDFIVLDRSSQRVLGGPFSGLSDAIGFAVRQSTTPGARIMYEALDQGGRLAGTPLVLRTDAV